MRLGTLAIGLTLSSFTSFARADVPPSCDSFDDRVTCAKADVGQACPSGGTCYEVGCTTMPLVGGNQTLYKCEVCPSVLDAGTCPTFQYGVPCADDAGTCRKAPPWCGGSGFACFGPNPELAPAPKDAATDVAPVELPNSDAAANTGGGPTSGAGGTAAATGGAGGSSVTTQPPAESDGGCSMAVARATRKAALPAFLLAAGGLAILLDRRRRGRHTKP